MSKSAALRATAASEPPLEPGVQRRSYAGVAPEVRKRLRRERLVEAGIEIFGTVGYHAATVRTVCAQARLTERYFYESFRSLDDLFSAVHGVLSVQLREATLNALAQTLPQPVELAESALRVFLEFIREDPRRARIVLIDAVSIGRVGAQVRDEATREYVTMMSNFVMLLYPDEVAARGMHADLLAAGLVGLNVHIATSWALEGFRTPIDEVLRTNLLPYRGLEILVKSDEWRRSAGLPSQSPQTRRRKSA